MSDKAESKLKLLLKKIELQTPPQHFTKEVMKEIEAIAEDKVYADPDLVTMLQKQNLPAPAKDFTYKVMKHVREKYTPTIEQPLISNGAWVFIILFVIIYLVVAVANGGEVGPVTRQFDFTSVGKYLTDAFIHFQETLFYLGIIVVSAILLLTADYFLKRKFTSHSV